MTDSPRKTLWKGKAKATQSTSQHEYFEDLNPVITYKHLLSQNLGVRDPLRVIALCDSDAFYAACEMVRLGVDKDVPLVVLQWDSLIAVNYPARKYGISRMDKKKDALNRCPHLQVVHVATYKEGEKEPGYWDNVDTQTHKVSLDYYRRESLKIAALFKEQLPGCEIEKASIDEAFFDFSKIIREVILQRYPYLAEVPSSGPDTPLPDPPPVVWNGLGNLVPIEPLPSESKTDEGADSGVELPNDLPSTWHDVALSIAAELMEGAREAVRIQLGYTTSAGIARNKFLAKLTASYRKPQSQSILRNAAIPNYLKPLEFQKIRFLGGKLGDALSKEFNATKVEDLLPVSLDELQTKFGEESIWIYEVLRGIDRNEVKDKGSVLNKSMLASKNLPKPITQWSEGQHWIRVLAAELALRLNDARTTSPSLWPKTIVLHARKGYETGRSKQSPFPFHREVTVDLIAAAGDKLWKELVGKNTNLKISSIQLAFTGIDFAEQGQQKIEGFLKPASSKRTRAASDAENSHQALLDDQIRPSESASLNRQLDKCSSNANQTNNSTASYTCKRCGKTLHLPTSIDDDEVQAGLAKLQMEHEDFHFAQDLSREGATIKVTSALSKPAPKPVTKPAKKRKVTEPSGIEKFFRK
ncbi:eta DNA polymerase [Panaeolus cyanescens]|uniref:DNA polymerase eta n=1 Tax=Panaeolus cyanescens TaxID=181874 RepID=A0A409Y6Y5_9AGAR|nr:eta DNA polymerase [Panaeolus cyanescens]